MEVRGGVSKEHEEIFMDGYDDWGDSFTDAYVCHLNIKLNKLCTSSMCCLLFASYSSIKLFLKTPWKETSKSTKAHKNFINEVIEPERNCITLLWPYLYSSSENSQTPHSDVIISGWLKICKYNTLGSFFCMLSELLSMTHETPGELWLPPSSTCLPATPWLEIHASTMPSSL